jgi:NADH dehydrogenase [ubiquinone] 1 alpha subcomplex assembly factor 2
MRQMGPGLGMGNAAAAGQAETRTGTVGVGADAGDPTIGTDAATQGKQERTTSTVPSGQEILDRESERMKVSGGPPPKVYTNPRVSDPEKAARREPATPPPPKGDPWKNARGGPSEDWQPQAWSPEQATRR